MARDVVVIDYGHGGVFAGQYQTKGKQYLYTEREPQVWIGEGLVNRCIAARLMNMLNRAGVRVYDPVAGVWVDRPRTWMQLEQQDVPLATRAARVNAVQRQHEGAPLVSLHSNALSSGQSGPGQPHGGVSVWTSKGTTQSDDLADALVWGLQTYDMHDFDVNLDGSSKGEQDHEADFYILTRTVGVAVLIESGFFDHWPDAQRLMSRAGQRALCHSYLEGIMRWLRRGKGTSGVSRGV